MCGAPDDPPTTTTTITGIWLTRTPGHRTSSRRGHLLDVGPVPEDGVAVGHHFGAGLLAEHAQQQQHAHERDHFHLQHHYGARLRAGYSSSGVGRVGVGRVGRLEPGRVVRIIHLRLRVPGAALGCSWKTGNARNIETEDRLVGDATIRGCKGRVGGGVKGGLGGGALVRAEWESLRVLPVLLGRGWRVQIPDRASRMALIRMVLFPPHSDA